MEGSMTKTTPQSHLRCLFEEIEVITGEEIEMERHALTHVPENNPIGDLDDFGKRLQTLRSKKRAVFDKAYETLTQAETGVKSRDDVKGIEDLCQELHTDMVLLDELIEFTCRKLFPEDVGAWLNYPDNYVFIGENFGVFLTSVEEMEDVSDDFPDEEPATTFH